MVTKENKNRKRIVTKIGYIFCVEFKDNTKGYFQYVANDMTQLNSSVIRAFKSHYPKSADINIDDIVNDDIDFYAHTILRLGLENNAWYKFGKSQEIGESDLKNAIFGCTYQHDLFSDRIIEVDPLTNWAIWHINEPRNIIGILPEYLYNVVQEGSVLPYKLIVDRMESGYFPGTRDIYSFIKRRVRPEYRGYIKYPLDNGFVYINFIGDEFNRAIVPIGGKFQRITKENPISKNLEITKKKFSDTNWKYGNFITEEEFNTAWNSFK